MSFSPDVSRRRELVLYFCRRTNNVVGRAINLLESRRVNFAPIATQTYTPEEAMRAFEQAMAYCDGIIRGIIAF